MKAPQGPGGKSAYQIAVENGFEGTEAQWLASLVGPNTVTSATTTNFTSGNVLFANSGFVGSLSRSGIDTRTSFPNDDVAAATSNSTAGTIVKRDSDGAISLASSLYEGLTLSVISSGDDSAEAIRGVAYGTFGIAGKFISFSGTAIVAESINGTYHATFGVSGDNRSAIERVRGWFVWFYSTFTGRLKTANITANRDWTLPDASGTIALTSDIVDSVTSATTSDGTADLSISNVSTATATVSGLLTAGHIHGNIAGTLYTHVRTGESVSKGDPVYVSGFHNGTGQPIVMRADASNLAKMPAIGVMDDAYAQNVSGANCVIAGTITSVDTDDFSINSPVYVGDGGGFSETIGTIPQQVGIVERSNTNNGAFVVTNNKVISSADISDFASAVEAIAPDAVTSETTSDGTASLDISNLTLSQDVTSGLQTAMTLSGNPTTVGDGQQIIWQWYNGGTPVTTAAITTEATGSTSDKLLFKTSESGSLATSLDLNNSLATFSGVVSSLGSTYQTGSTFTYNGASAAAHRTALGVSASADTVLKSAYTPSHSLLVQQSGTGSPSSLSVGNNTILGRASGGGSNIAALSASDTRTVLGLSTLATTTPAVNVATFLESPSSANLAAAVTGETGSGSLVFGTSPTIDAPTISGSAAFTSTTRPTSAGTGTPAATSLITKADGDKVFFPLEGLFQNAYKVPLTNNLGASSGLSALSISAANDTISSFTSSVTSGNYATWCSSHARCTNSGNQLVLPSGIGLRARILIGTNSLRRAKLLLGGLSGSSVLGSGVLDARGFGVEIEPNASITGQIRFRIIYRNQSSQTILGDWTEYISNLANTSGIILWFYRLNQQILAAYKTSLYGSIAPTNWQSIPSVSITSGDNLQTGVVRMKNFQVAAEQSYSNAYVELSDIYETHNIFPNL
jgi:hypothetical protein